MLKTLTLLILWFRNATKLIIVVCTVVAMFTLTTYWRNEFNKRESFVEQVLQRKDKGEKISVSVANFSLARDEDAVRSLYRKIWTYDALIIASGVLLCLAIPNHDKSKRQNIRLTT